MSYAEILSEIIADSRLTLKEISELCKKLGVNVVPSYLSKLKGGHQPPASDEINEAIAKTCEADDICSDLLRFLAVQEKLPKHYLDMQQELTDFALTALDYPTSPFYNPFTERMEVLYDTMGLIGRLRGLRMMYGSSKGILEFYANGGRSSEQLHQVKDNTLAPLIPKGCIVSYDRPKGSHLIDVKNGDVLVLKGSDAEIELRRVYIVEDQWILTTEQADIPPVRLDDRTKVIGVVRQVTHNLFNPRA